MCNVRQGKFSELDTGEDGYKGLAPVNSYEANGFGLLQQWQHVGAVFRLLRSKLARAVLV